MGIIEIKDSTLVSVASDNHHAIKNDFHLSQNFPNPFNPTTKIKYTIPVGAYGNTPLQIRLYDILGNEVATLVNQIQPAGEYEVEFSAEQLSSGIYFYKLQTGDFISTKKMLMIK